MVSENDYVAQDSEEELALTKAFGGFTVESITVSKDLQSISFFCSVNGAILGIGIKSVSEFQHIGLIDDLVCHQFDIDGPDEVVEEILTETAPGGGGDLLITV